jgi:hypothetical protein
MSNSITIAGKPFNVEPRYAEGHVLTANEASALNQTYFENLRNNFATKAKEGADQDAFDAYVKDYQFGVRSAGGSRDPILAEAMELARDSIKDTLRKAGKKLADFKASAISKAAEKLLAHPEKGPEFKELARQRVEQMRSAASDEVDTDLLDLINAEQAGADTPAPDAGKGEATPDAEPTSSGRRGRAA